VRQKVKDGRGNQNMDFMIRHVYPELPCFDAGWLNLRGPRYDNP
jgi:hypothetical protein